MVFSGVNLHGKRPNIANVVAVDVRGKEKTSSGTFVDFARDLGIFRGDDLFANTRGNEPTPKQVDPFSEIVGASMVHKSGSHAP